MENRGDADAGAEVLGVGRDGNQGLGRGLERQVVMSGRTKADSVDFLAFS
jgi:hypothetical protein